MIPNFTAPLVKNIEQRLPTPLSLSSEYVLELGIGYRKLHCLKFSKTVSVSAYLLGQYLVCTATNKKCEKRLVCVPASIEHMVVRTVGTGFHLTLENNLILHLAGEAEEEFEGLIRKTQMSMFPQIFGKTSRKSVNYEVEVDDKEMNLVEKITYETLQNDSDNTTPTESFELVHFKTGSGNCDKVTSSYIVEFLKREVVVQLQTSESSLVTCITNPGRLNLNRCMLPRAQSVFTLVFPLESKIALLRPVRSLSFLTLAKVFSSSLIGTSASTLLAKDWVEYQKQDRISTSSSDLIVFKSPTFIEKNALTAGSHTLFVQEWMESRMVKGNLGSCVSRVRAMSSSVSSLRRVVPNKRNARGEWRFVSQNTLVGKKEPYSVMDDVRNGVVID